MAVLVCAWTLSSGDARDHNAAAILAPHDIRVNPTGGARVLSSGSFPRSPANLSHGQRRQFRDALILEAHIREGRNIFVTNDERGFIRDGRREKLEALFPVRILTRAEFSDACAAGSLWPLSNKRQSSSAASGQ